MVSLIALIVRHGKAYVPVQAQTDTGLHVAAEPVFVAELTPEGLRVALERAVAAGHPRIPHPTQEEWRHWRSPVLKAAKVRSWKQMATDGAGYTITWSEQSTKLYISHVDNPAKWRQAQPTARVFPPRTELAVLVEAILEDVRAHPQLLENNG